MVKRRHIVFIVLVEIVLLVVLSGLINNTGKAEGKNAPCAEDKYVYVLVDLSSSAQSRDRNGITRLGILDDVLRYLVMYQMLVPSGKMKIKIMEYTSAFEEGFKDAFGQNLVLEPSFKIPQTQIAQSENKILLSKVYSGPRKLDHLRAKNKV